MGATSIKSRILDLLSDVTIDNTAVGQFATDSAKEIINVLPEEMLWSMSTTSSVTGSGASITSARILSVSRNGYTAMEIPFSDMARYEPNSGSIYEATAKSPVYYKKAGKVFVLPTASSGATVEHISYPAITFSNDLSDFVGAPDEIEHLIILKTAVKARLAELNEFQDDSEEHQLKVQDLQLLQQEYTQALSTFLAGSRAREAAERAEE
tara:strand:+ start:124 stop:753 length:630 start_codon:yes stop_codon:yes gene_type:complete